MTTQQAIQALIELYSTAYSGRIRKALDMAIKALEQPEITHCKDCKHYGKESCYVKIQMLWELKPDDFCSQAERKKA